MKSTLIKYAPLLFMGMVLLIGFPLVRCGRYHNNPLHQPVQLAAGFGEIRPDHFHMGADLRTNGREGLPVYTIKEGYISHISIQSEGYGKAIWITHPDGTTTLYAHLSAFTGMASTWISQQQYQHTRWQQDADCVPGYFPVKKGQCIGYSGNTGTSAGPHLHFEIRNTASGKSLNPLTNVLPTPDTIPPVIKALYWYDRCNSVYEDTAHLITQPVTRLATPFIGIGITSYDKFTAGRFVTGIDKAQLYKDNVLQYEFSVQQLSSADTRYVNACIDYGKAVNSHQTIQFLFSLPGNHLPYTRRFASGGVIDMSDRKQHQIKIVVSDVAGHQTVKTCRLQYNGSKACLSPAGATQLVYPGNACQLSSKHATFLLPQNTFYDAVPLRLVETKSNMPGAVSPAVIMKMPIAPVDHSFTVHLSTSLPQDYPLRKQTVMVLINQKDTCVVKGSWKQNQMQGLFNKTGTLQLVADNIPPIITNAQINAAYLQFTCTDNLGAVDSFRAEADGHWLAFDRKGHCFRYTKEEHYPGKAHNLTVTITDVAGNITIKKYTL